MVEARIYLPINFQLGVNDVYCGRGKLCFNHIGNKHFRSVVFANGQRYQMASCKFQKSAIIQEVVDFIRSLSPDGGFVKREDITLRYYEVSNMHAVSAFQL
jgi:hypothetical protein